MAPLKPGWKWLSGRLQYRESEVEYDINIGPQKRTTLIMNQMLNSLVSYLKFTTEDCEDFVSGTLPTLDCQLWVENQQIRYKFFEKSQVSNRMLLHNTALAKASLTSSIVQ